MSKRYRELWPDQERAKWTVRNWVRRGKIVVPDRCERCGELRTRKELEAHHWSYKREHWGDVIWLCKKTCHKIVHKELGPHWVDAETRPDLRLTKTIGIAQALEGLMAYNAIQLDVSFSKHFIAGNWVPKVRLP